MFCWPVPDEEKELPHKVECEADIAPVIHYYFNEIDKCDVDTQYGIYKNNSGSKQNEECIKQVKNYLLKEEHAHSKLVYITHGFYSKESPNHWLYKLKDALISRYPEKNLVVGIVYWVKGARWFKDKDTASNSTKEVSNRESSLWKFATSMEAICCIAKTIQSDDTRYGVAAVTTWTIGNIIGYVHESILDDEKDHSKIKTYCIGHSLGAHVCGFFGKMMKHLKPNDEYSLTKIVGLDPAGPLFDYHNHHFNLRLNKSDAKLVEVFHTNTLHLGFTDPIGHIDFYINGGGSQYWCHIPNSNLGFIELILLGSSTEATNTITCAHEYAHFFLKHLAINMVPCYATWKTTNRNLIEGSQSTIFYPGSLEPNNIPFGKHYLYIRPNTSKECKSF